MWKVSEFFVHQAMEGMQSKFSLNVHQFCWICSCTQGITESKCIKATIRTTILLLHIRDKYVLLAFTNDAIASFPLRHISPVCMHTVIHLHFILLAIFISYTDPMATETIKDLHKFTLILFSKTASLSLTTYTYI